MSQAAPAITRSPAEVVRSTPVSQAANGICYAMAGEVAVNSFDLERMVAAVPGKVAAALDRKAYYFVPLTVSRSEEHTSELQSQSNLVCRLLLEKKNRHGHRLRRHGAPDRNNTPSARPLLTRFNGELDKQLVPRESVMRLRPRCRRGLDPPPGGAQPQERRGHEQGARAANGRSRLAGSRPPAGTVDSRVNFRSRTGKKWLRRWAPSGMRAISLF